MNLLYSLLAAFGLGFLIFIHEMGHYVVARLCGIEVEAFSIGFGRPLLKWERKGVRWQIGWIPFGGYVRVKGTDKEGDQEPHEVPGGFFAASPWRRILFALGGPVVNLIFAFVAFSALWMAGGRDKPFGDFTRRVGWVDPHSQLYAEGLRPGDEVTGYDGHPLKTAHDHLYAPLLVGETGTVSGYHIDYRAGTRTPFHSEASVYAHPEQADLGLLTFGVLAPAQYLLFQPEGLLPGSPLAGTGIEKGDRIFWVDGAQIFSVPQLTQLLNDGRALVSVERDGERILRRVPRVPLGDLSLSYEQRADYGDLRWELGHQGELLVIPYEFSQGNVVEGRVSFIDAEMEESLFPEVLLSSAESPLRVGDQIVAVDGKPVGNMLEMLQGLQERQVQVVVRRVGERPLIAADEADAAYDETVDWAGLAAITRSIGSREPLQSAGPLHLLPPVVPISLSEVAQVGGPDSQVAQLLREQRKEIEAIDDPDRRAEALAAFEKQAGTEMFATQFADRRVRYNPAPWVLYGDTVMQSYRTIKSLVLGNLSPKMLSGPVGMVTVMHYSWSVGAKEALFWLGLISLNLGVLNLLPIPVLDGGHICFALYEAITRRRLKVKTMERLVIPFMVLLIGFFIFVTYQDIIRLFGRFL